MQQTEVKSSFRRMSDCRVNDISCAAGVAVTKCFRKDRGDGKEEVAYGVSVGQKDGNRGILESIV